jgi:hypothetical protein
MLAAMTATEPDTDAAPGLAEPEPGGRPTLTAADLVAGVPVVVLAVVGTMSLAWAHAHHHSLPAVLVSSVVVLALLGWALVRLGGRPVVVRGTAGGLLAVLGAGLVAGVMFFPGFSYGVSDKDPGTYVAIATQIARGGSYSFIDPAQAHGDLPVVYETPNARFPAMWVRNPDTGLMVPQFYHLWPALMATMYDVAGFGGITATTPICAVVAVMALVGLLRRVSGVPAAVIGGALLATNFIEVWQAKYPTAEILAQALFVGGLLAVVIAVQERWRPAAFLAGLSAGVGFLNRADGWLLVMLAAATLGAVYVSRRADGEVVWGAAGLGIVLPYALFQAYGTAKPYTIDNHVPNLTKTLLSIAALVVLTFAARLLLRGPVQRLIEACSRQRTQFVLGFAVCALCGIALAVGFARPRLFGESYIVSRGRTVRSYDEQSLVRLSWFLTKPGFALVGLGVPVVALRRWRTAAWAVILPTLLLTPLFLYHAHNSTRLMWWVRRYASNVLPGLIVLMALALAFGWAWRWRDRYVLRIPSAVVALALVAVFVHQSWPLRSHDEWGGSFAISKKVAALSGDKRGVYLWQRGPFCCSAPTTLWASTVWMERGELSVLLPREPVEIPPYVLEYRKAFPNDPLFVVWHGPDYPPGLESLHLQPVLHPVGSMPFWQESEFQRPHYERRINYNFVVYRVP